MFIEEILKHWKELPIPEKVHSNNTLYLPKERLWVNPKVFKLMTVEEINKDIPKEHITKKDFKDIYGNLNKMSIEDPVSNLLWDYIHFLDCNIFRPAALAFESSTRAVKGTNTPPRYCPYLEGTTQHKNYWKEEFSRCKDGYEPIVDGQPCGLRIPGEFYFYLNYCVIQMVWVDANGKKHDNKNFPDFLSMDYYYFKEIEARESPELYPLPSVYKQALALVKSRRKGFSFKAAAGCVWKTAFFKSYKVIIASDTGYDAALCFKKCMPIIDWLSTHTPFGRKNPGDPKTNGGWKHIQTSLTDESGHFTFGLENTKTKKRSGRLSEIMTVSLAVKDDRASGEGVQRIYFEESGKITNIKKAWAFARESLKIGETFRGIAIIFGTGGSMAKDNGNVGSSKGFSELFYNPVGNELASFTNIYEYAPTEKKCGYFVCDMWYTPSAEIFIGGKKYSAIDKNGNAHFWVADLYLNMKREEKRNSGKKEDYDLYLTQRCKTPQEAFLVTEGNVFPTADLLARKNDLELSKGGFELVRTAGEIVEYNGIVSFRPDLEGNLQPIDTFQVDSLDRSGCLLQYEPPMRLNGVVPPGAYIISVDPIGQNTVSGKSLTSIVVMKTPKYLHDLGPSKIVATYKGRNSVNPQGHVHELLLKLSKYYNAQITFENDRDGGILQYFIRKGELNRLMSKPEMTLSKYLPNSTTALREFGHSMATPRHKEIGENLLLEWLLRRVPKKKVVNSEGEVIELEGLRYLDMLEDRAVIEELIAYNRKGNFDVVMALMGAIIQINEHWNEDFVQDRREEINDISSFWNEVHNNLYGTTQQKLEFQYNKNKHLTENPIIEW